MPIPTDPTPSGGHLDASQYDAEELDVDSDAHADQAARRMASSRHTILLEVAIARELMAVVKELVKRMERHLDYIEDALSEER